MSDPSLTVLRFLASWRATLGKWLVVTDPPSPRRQELNGFESKEKETEKTSWDEHQTMLPLHSRTKCLETPLSFSVKNMIKMFSVSTVKLKRNDRLELPFFFISSFTLTDHLLGKILFFSNDFVGLFFLLIVTLKKKKHSVLPSLLFFDLLSGLDDSMRGRKLLIRVTAFRILVHKCF